MYDQPLLDHNSIAMDNDKNIESLRYDKRAQSLLATRTAIIKSFEAFGSMAVQPIYRAPYIYYEQCISRNVLKNHDVLELGAGIGLHTYALVQTGARVVASDISSKCLEVLSHRIVNVKTAVADMEALLLNDHSFDVVTSAGSLSYGDPALVDAEIKRVLRPGGVFMCVDSLNHNPVYRLNRWLQYKRGHRTKSTFLYMPTIERIQSISRGFKSAEVRYFGAVSYLMPVLAHLIGQNRAAAVSDHMDQLINVHRAAFKFVLVAKGRL